MMKSRMGLLALAAFAPIAVHAAQPVAPQFGAFGIDLSARDTTLRQGDDFWAYANGGWSARTPISGDVDDVGVAPALARDGQERVHGLLEGLASNGGTAPNGQKIGDFYASWMNQSEVERRGLDATRPYLSKIFQARTREDIQTLLADVDYPSPIAFGVAPQPSDPTRNTVSVAQGELGMPQDYYLNPGDHYLRLRARYLAYVESILRAAGFSDPANKAAAIVALETDIAKGQLTPAQQREGSGDRLMPLQALAAQFPRWDWPLMLKAAGLGGAPQVLVANDTALLSLGSLVAERPVSVWRDYLPYRFLPADQQHPAPGKCGSRS